MPSTPEETTTDELRVKLQIDKKEHIPMEFVSVIVQRRVSGNLEVAQEIRFEPVCTGDDNQGLDAIAGYDEHINAADGTCEVSIGGDTDDNTGGAYTFEDIRNDVNNDRPVVKGTGYGYGTTFIDDAGNLQGGYGYHCPDNSFTGPSARCSKTADSDPSSGSGLTGYFTLEQQDWTTYGYGYSDNRNNDVTITWTVPMTWSKADLEVDEDYEVVAVVWTGSSVLRSLQTPATVNTVNIDSAPSDGGGAADDEDGTGAQTIVKSIGTCGSACTINLGTNVQAGDTIRINFGSGDDLFSWLQFVADEDLGSQVEIDRFGPDSRPAGVPDPGSVADPRYYFNLSVTSGGSSIADKVSDFQLLWKLRHEWLNGTLQGFERDTAYSDSVIQLGHFQGGAWIGESTSRETSDAGLPSDADPSTFRYYNSSFGSLSTFSAGAFDSTAPTFSNAKPTGTISNRRPTISVDVSDGGSGVNANSITMTLDGQTVQHSFSDGTVSFTPKSDLSFASHSVKVTAEDEFGNQGNRSWTFTVEEVVDSVAPTISNLQPAPDATVKQDATISASYSDDMSGIDLDSVTLTVDGEDVTSDAEVTSSSITYAPDGGFSSGEHTAELTVSDVAGNQQTESWSFNVEGAGNLMMIVLGIVAVIVIAAIAAWYLLVYQKQQ